MFASATSSHQLICNVNGVPGLNMVLEVFDEQTEQLLFESGFDLDRRSASGNNYPPNGVHTNNESKANNDSGLSLGSTELHHPALFGSRFKFLLQLIRSVGLGSILSYDFCVMLSYSNLRGVGSHVDSLTKWGSSVLVCCLGKECILRMSPTSGETIPIDITLPRRCVYELTGESRFTWKHAVISLGTVSPSSATSSLISEWNPLKLRRSIVFRTTSAFELVQLQTLNVHDSLEIKRAKDVVLKFCRNHQVTQKQYERIMVSALCLTDATSKLNITGHTNTALIASENGDPRHSTSTASQLLRRQVMIMTHFDVQRLLCKVEHSWSIARKSLMYRPQKPNLCVSRIVFQKSTSETVSSTAIAVLSNFFSRHACLSGSCYHLDNIRHETILSDAGLVANHKLSNHVMEVSKILVEEGLYSFPTSETSDFPGKVILSRHAEKQCVVLLLSVLLAISPVSLTSISMVQYLRVLAKQVFPLIILVQSKPPCSDCFNWLSALSRFLKLPKPIRVAGDGGEEWKSGARFKSRRCHGNLYTQQFACKNCCDDVNDDTNDRRGILSVCICQSL